MDHFHFQNNELYVEQLAVKEIIQQYDTPCYVYSKATLEHHYQVFNQALKPQPHLICFSVKANSNIAILNTLAKMGSGFDIVSIGELYRVLKAQGNPQKIIFSGVAKQDHELEEALKHNIYCFNIESHDEVIRLNAIAQRMNVKAPIAFRVNPDIDPQSHPYISTGLKENKFGIPIEEALNFYALADQLQHIKILGIASHIGSQLLKLDPFIEMAKKLKLLKSQLEKMNIPIEHLDLGGGLGVKYQSELPPIPKEYASSILKELNDPHLKIVIEPGRSIAANAGILVTKVILTKQNGSKKFCIVDAGMNDLLRPSLYNAEQMIIPVTQKQHEEKTYDVVGPICETGDFLGKDRKLKIKHGDLLAVRGSGAYGFVMSSNYNSRPRPPEILVDKNNSYCIRYRERYEDLFSQESIPQ